ncbi:MAG: hypothetical protein QW838_04180 [Candidatus Nitrosotenuis sp.]
MERGIVARCARCGAAWTGALSVERPDPRALHALHALRALRDLYVGERSNPGAHPPLVVAVARALVGAFLVGAAAAVSSWQAGGSGELIAQSSLSASIGYLSMRAGVEGLIDARRDRRSR